MPLDELLKSERKQFGEHLTSLFLDVNLEIKPPSMILLSTGDTEAREITTRVTQEYVLTPLAK
ncbi:MAG: hypothetical protein ACREJM_10465, partial [Candidatus Saccharimonadales bacterium]